MNPGVERRSKKDYIVPSLRGHHVVEASGNGLIATFVADFEDQLVDGSSPQNPL